MSTEQLYPDRIWSTFKALTGTPKQVLHNTSFQEGRKYQLLEVAVGLVLAKLRPEFEWTITPIQGDQGIDFKGLHRLFEIEDLQLASYEVIAGQCKRAKGKIRLEKELFYDVYRITEIAKPSHVILAVAAPASKKQQERARNSFVARFHRPFTFFGLAELDFLFRRYLLDLKPLFDEWLDEDTARELFDHFSKAPSQHRARPDIYIQVPPTGATGVPFEINLSFEAGAVVGESLLWKWTSPTIRIEDAKVATLRLVAPISADQSPGKPLDFESSLRITETIRLVGYVTGLQSLGEISLVTKTGSVIEKLKLGEIELTDQNTPPFFWEPFEHHLEQFEQLWERTKAGVPVAIALTGAGGAGKTRLGEELGFRAIRTEGRYFRVAHPKTQGWPYRIFADLLTQLAEFPIAADSPSDKLIEFLASRNAEFAKRVQPTIHYLFRTNSSSTLADTSFNEEELIQLMCFVLLESSRQQPLFIHFTDCHWCQFSILNLLAEVMSRLRTNGPSALTRILLVYEGRVGEMLPDSASQAGDRSIAPWEEFIAAHLVKSLHIDPLSTEQSSKFLDYVFESSETPYRRVPRSLLVNQDRLKEEIIRYAKGNPLHMIEQINLLRHQGFISRNQRTGLFYLAKWFKKRYAPPQGVEQLIRMRLDFIRANNPEAIRLLCGIAFIKDRISRPLLRHLRYELAPEVALNTLLFSEFLEGILQEATEVAFRHENYFRVAHGYELSQEDRALIVEAYLKWFEKTDRESPQSMLEKAMVLKRSQNPPIENIQRILNSVIEASEAQLTHDLTMQALVHLLATYPQTSILNLPLSMVETIQDYRLQLSKLASLVGDWEETASGLERAVRDFQILLENWHASPADRWRIETKYYGAEIELADAKKNQLRYPEAIEILSEVLDELVLRLNSDLLPGEMKGAFRGLSLWARDRLGVALWFDGRLEQGQEVLLEGLELAQNANNPIAEYNLLLDYGTTLLHGKPEKGVKLLSKALNIVKRPTVATLPRDEHIVKWQRCLGQLVADNDQGTAESMHEIMRELQSIYLASESGGYTHEMGGSALVLGSCRAQLRDPRARKWLLTAISIAQKSSYLEYLWKGHLNLAQCLLRLDSQESEGVAHHAEQSQRLITVDLERRLSPDDKVSRLALFKLPLAQLARIWQSIDDPRFSELLRKHPEIQAYFRRDGGIRARRHSPGQVIHISEGPADYFLMN